MYWAIFFSGSRHDGVWFLTQRFRPCWIKKFRCCCW